MSIRPRKSLLNKSLQRPSALNSTYRDLNYLWLDKNENIDPELLKVSAKILSEIPDLTLATYPEAGETYRELAKWLDVEPECLILTPGSDGAIRLVFEAFVEQGNVVVHTEPSFAMYSIYSQMFGAKVHALEYKKSESEPFIALSSIVDTLLEYKPKIFCLPNPDSPTGTIFPPDDLRAMLDVCEKVGTVMLLDEAYHPFYNWTAVPWVKQSRNLIVARTFAKAWGVAGLRVGYAVAHQETIAFLHKLRPMYEVSSLAVEFMSRMLDHHEDMEKSVKRINEAKKYFVNEMTLLGFTVLPTYGNFSHVDFGDAGDAMHKKLSQHVYYRKSFSCDCLERYSRFTIAPHSTMVKVVNLIKEAILGTNE